MNLCITLPRTQICNVSVCVSRLTSNSWRRDFGYGLISKTRLAYDRTRDHCIETCKPNILTTAPQLLLCLFVLRDKVHVLCPYTFGIESVCAKYYVTSVCRFLLFFFFLFVCFFCFCVCVFLYIYIYFCLSNKRR